jgi:hypothetical protein
MAVDTVTIERGQDWGTNAPLPPGAPVVANDADLHATLNATLNATGGRPEGLVVGLLGGDLCRTVGGIGERGRLTSSNAVTMPCDVLEVTVAGRTVLAAAHVVARRPGRLGWWRGPLGAVMNAEFIGNWDVAPRSHPNDGRAEVFETSMSLDDRIKARRRLRLGTHVPHPAIRQRSVSSGTVEFGEALMVWVDGVALGPATALSFAVTPDAFRIVV